MLDSVSSSGRNLDRDLDLVASRTDKVGASAVKADTSINQLTGRLRLMADVAAILGPGLVPIGAVAVPAVAGLASQLGFAAVGMASLVTASQGVGDALSAVAKADLEPTAQNIIAAQDAMARLGPEAQNFVRAFDGLKPTLTMIRDQAAAGWFPGLTEALSDFERIGPKVGDIFQKIGEAGGNLTAEFAEGLAGPKGQEFLSFVEDNAPQALEELGRTVGNTIEGLGNLWMAFDPLSDDMSSFLMDMSQGFADWSANLSQTQGFQEFVDYIRENGPRVGNAIVAISNAILQIAEAAAPLGGPVLDGITAFSNAVAAIADSDLGTPIMAAVAAFAALNRVMAVSKFFSGSAATGMLLGPAISGIQSYGSNLKSTIPTMQQFGTYAYRMGQSTTEASEKTLAARSAVRGFASEASHGLLPLAGIAAATGALGDDMQNTAVSMGLMSGAFGPIGVGIGTFVGAAIDAKSAAKDLDSAMAALNEQMDRGSYKGINAAADIAQSKVDKSRRAVDLLGGTIGGIVPTFLSATGAFSEFANVGDQAAADIDSAREAAERLAEMPQAKGGLEDALMGPLGGVSEAAHQAAMSVQDLNAALAGLSGWLDKRAALRGFDDAMKGLGDSIKNGFSREDAENIDAVGRSIIQVASSIKNKGARADFLDGAVKSLQRMGEDAGPRASKAIDNLINKLGKFGVTKVNKPKLDVDERPAIAAAKRVENLLFDLPDEVQTDIRTNGVPQSMSQIRAMQKQYNLTPEQVQTLMAIRDQASGPVRNILGLIASVKSKQVTITTVMRTVYANQAASNRAQVPLPGVTPGSADGGTVPVTGRGYVDRHPYLLADGEEVISNRYGQADRNRWLLKAINANRLAAGGTAGVAASRPYWGLAADPVTQQALRLGGAFDDLTRATFELGDGIKDSLKERVKEARERAELLRKEADEQRQRFQQMRQAQEELIRSVRDQYRSDLIGDGSEDVMVASILSRTGEDGEALSDEVKRKMLVQLLEQRGVTGAAAQNSIQYGSVDELAALASQANPLNAPGVSLQQDIARVKESIRLFEELRAKGFNGPALQEVFQSGNVEALRAYAALSKADLRDIEQAYRERNQLSTSLGGMVGADLNDEIRAQRKVTQEALGEAREANKLLKKLEDKLEKANRQAEKAPKQTGEFTAQALNGARVAGRAGRS